MCFPTFLKIAEEVFLKIILIILKIIIIIHDRKKAEGRKKKADEFEKAHQQRKQDNITADVGVVPRELQPKNQ